MNKAIIAVVAVIVIAGGAFVLVKGNSNKDTSSSSKTSSSSAADKTDASTAETTAPPSASGESTVVVTANDTSATPDTITVKKGDKVSINFKVSSAGTYHGGLEFKSTDPSVDSGPIAQGGSGTATFTATKSFKFTPYWYKSSVQKDYFVTVNVQ